VRSLIRVVTSSESSARDAAAIGAGVPSRALMQRAGAAAAAEVMLRYRDALSAGVLVLAGPGNNGGDAWVVARALSVAGADVRVVEPVVAKTPDAKEERALALRTIDAAYVVSGEIPEGFDRGERLIVDGLLGTGATGEPRGLIAGALTAARAMRARGATVIALDIPSGLDATTGEGSALSADLTLTFGTMKRAHVLNREVCGGIVVLDIGLGPYVDVGDSAPMLVDELWVAPRIPVIAPSAHKGTRKKLAIIGGAGGMAGAAILAARAALRSGVGMVKLVVSRESLEAVQEAEPHALAASWPETDTAFEHDVKSWADAVVIGPGLGRQTSSEELLERALRCWLGPTLLDADAITLFEGGRVSALSDRLRSRPALLTPHVAEFGRLAGRTVDDVLAERFDVGREMSNALRATVLLKGTPTVISSADGQRLVSATGTPALATAGSGDVLSGIAGTLLAQLGDPFVAGAIGAWIHGRAAERVPATPESSVRGIVLDDVVAELRDAWRFDDRPTRYPVLTELPNLGGAR
jgi:NAD(P)H-hydrate epimerase